MLRTSLVCLVFCISLIAQGDPDRPQPAIPKDPRAAAAAMPLREPVMDGHVVRVVDGDHDTPIEGADVLVIGITEDPKESARLRALQEQIMSALGNNAPRMDAMLALAALEGTRYRTNADGVASVAVSPGVSVFLIMHEGRLTQSSTREEGPVKFFAPRWLDVRVVAADGKPAADVVVGIAPKRKRSFDASPSFHPTLRAQTDRLGICRFNLADERLRTRAEVGEVVVKAFAATSKSIEQTVAITPLPEAPTQLTLPECGQVRFILYDQEERPTERLKSASLRATDPDLQHATTSPASTLEPDNAVFAWVEVGQEVQITAWVDGMPGSVSFTGQGPSRAREFVVVEGRLASGPPIVAVRVLDKQGKPLVSDTLGYVLRKEGGTGAGAGSIKTVGVSYGTIETDRDGRLEIPTQLGSNEQLYLTRREAGDATAYLGGARIDLGELRPGRCDFGDVQLQEETVMARRQLIDETGAPVAGVWVRGEATFAGRPKGIMFGGGGSSNPKRWDVEHRVRSDQEGWIELREAAPVQGEFSFYVEGQQDVSSPGGLWIETGSRGTLQVYRNSTITARLGEGRKHADSEVKLVHRESGVEMARSFRDGVLGPIRCAAGVYDLKFGDNTGIEINNVEAPAGGEVSDPRLDPLDFGDMAHWIKVDVVSDTGQPVPRALVWLRITRPGGGEGGTGHHTKDNGQVTVLVPSQKALEGRSCKLVVDVKGCVQETIEAPTADVRVVLKSVAPMTLRVEGLPELPEKLQLRLHTVAKENRTALSMGGDSVTGTAEIVVQPRSLGSRVLQIYLEPKRRAGLDNKLRMALSRQLPRKSIQFEFEATGQPVDPIVFELSKEQIEDLEARIETARTIIEEHRDG